MYPGALLLSPTLPICLLTSLHPMILRLYVYLVYKAPAQISHSFQNSLVQRPSMLPFLLVCKYSHFLVDQSSGQHSGGNAATSAFLLQHNHPGKHTYFPHQVVVEWIGALTTTGSLVCTSHLDYKLFTG